MRADANKATGAGARAEGTGTLASGVNSHAEGASTQATNNTAHAEGISTVASGLFSHAQGGSSIASGNYGHAEGDTTTASGSTSHAEGNASVSSGMLSHAQGYYAAASRWGQHAQAGGRFTAAGDAQTCVYVARGVSTGTTPVVLTLDGDPTITLTGELTNVLTIPINRVYGLRIDVTARRTDVPGAAGTWNFVGQLTRGSSGNATLQLTGLADRSPDFAGPASGASGWQLALAVNTTDATNNYLTLTTSQASEGGTTVIRWVARITTVEVG